MQFIQHGTRRRATAQGFCGLMHSFSQHATNLGTGPPARSMEACACLCHLADSGVPPPPTALSRQGPSCSHCWECLGLTPPLQPTHPPPPSIHTQTHTPTHMHTPGACPAPCCCAAGASPDAAAPPRCVAAPTPVGLPLLLLPAPSCTGAGYIMAALTLQGCHCLGIDCLPGLPQHVLALYLSHGPG